MRLIVRPLSQKGVGLIEVLMALVILAVGALGMGGLHSSSLQHNQAAYIHSRATVLAGDMLDRIRANNALAKSSSDYQVGLTDEVYNRCESNDYPDQCETGSCSPEQLASYDIQQWKFHLNCELPGTQGAISFVEVDGERIYTIRLNFPDGRGQPADDLLLRGAL